MEEAVFFQEIISSVGRVKIVGKRCSLPIRQILGRKSMGCRGKSCVCGYPKCFAESDMAAQWSKPPVMCMQVCACMRTHTSTSTLWVCWWKLYQWDVQVLAHPSVCAYKAGHALVEATLGSHWNSVPKHNYFISTASLVCVVFSRQNTGYLIIGLLILWHNYNHQVNSIIHYCYSLKGTFG